MSIAGGTIERAYELARSGICRSVEEINKRLSKEGFDSPQAHLAGRGIRRELTALMRASRVRVDAPPVDTTEETQ